MTKRIFRSICFVAIAVFLASLILIMGVLYSYFSGGAAKAASNAVRACRTGSHQ